jgi:hypothetical protein
MDDKTCTFYKDGVSQGSISFSSSAMANKTVVPIAISYYNGSVYTFNFGQRPFAYTPPSGFKSLCTTNLPDPTIKQPNQYFDATTYTGNGGTKTVTNSGEFQPDLVWIKMRSDAAGNELFDSIRGANNVLYTNATNAESNSGTMSSFNSNGFTALYQSGDISTNNNGSTFVGWQWKAASANTTNTDGSITSTIRANPTAGFSVVTYTGNGTAGATVGHGLTVVPKMLIVKNRAQGTYGNWNVWHTALTGSEYLALNATTAIESNNNRWNGTVPTSEVFSLGADSFGNTNKSGDTYVAYCFAEVEGYSKFGSYTGISSTDGPFNYTGFRPKYVLIKSSSATQSWYVYDSARNTYNLTNLFLLPNATNAESIGESAVIDMVSNGFKLRGTTAGVNQSGSTYIYMAFAESPFKYSRAR